MWVLIKGLPPESATFRDRPEGWTIEIELAASLIETLDRWGRQWLSMHVKSSQMPDPVRIPRPEALEQQAEIKTQEKKDVVTDSRAIEHWFETA